MTKKKTREQFIKEAVDVQKGRYTYDNFEYVDAKTKSYVTCPVHGDFLVSPNVHLKGVGCPKCYNENRSKLKKVGVLDFDTFAERGVEKHSGKYQYVRESFVNGHSDVDIICPYHGKFKQIAFNHLSGAGCPKCASDKKRACQVKEESLFKREAKAKHNGKYTYENVRYVNTHTKVDITCPIHGSFWQTPLGHLNGNGCPYCAHRVVLKDEFLAKAEDVHKGKYDYSLVPEDVTKEKIEIICKSCGYKFKQFAWSHLQGHGCPHCRQSSLESAVRSILEEQGIAYEFQKTFPWLVHKKNMFIDFYLPEYNVGIEVQGKQHYNSSKYWRPEDPKIIRLRDIVKNQLCAKNGLQLIYVAEAKYNTNVLLFDELKTFIENLKENVQNDNR